MNDPELQTRPYRPTDLAHVLSLVEDRFKRADARVQQIAWVVGLPAAYCLFVLEPSLQFPGMSLFVLAVSLLRRQMKKELFDGPRAMILDVDRQDRFPGAFLVLTENKGAEEVVGYCAIRPTNFYISKSVVSTPDPTAQETYRRVLQPTPLSGTEDLGHSTPTVHFLNLQNDLEESVSIPHTLRLLRAAVRCMLDEQSGMALGKAYEAILAMVVFSLVRQLKLPQTTGSELLQHKFRNYLQTSKLDVCITSALERPKFGTVEWGVTNRNETLEEDYGLLFPAINGGLVDQYESFCNDKSPLSGQLGFLIVVTYIHELGRTWLRHVSTTKIPPFWTTSTLIRSQDAESGRLLESLLLGGDLRVAWKTDADCRSVDRFTKIDAIWLRLSYSTDYPQYRRLNPYALTYFHNVILGEDAVDLQFLLTNIATAASNPAVDLRELEMRGPLLRVAPQSTSPQTSYENSSCSIGLGLRFEGYCGMHQ